jgi:hypothetical protein
MKHFCNLAYVNNIDIDAVAEFFDRNAKSLLTTILY